MVHDVNFKKIPLFNNLPKQEYQRLQDSLSCIDVKAGTVLIRENDFGNDFYIILDGRLDVIKSMGMMGDRVLTTLSTGDFIGEMSLLNPDGLRTATVLCRTNANCCKSAMPIPGTA